jgi:acetolactate synthase-1/2/3 large subunit
MSDALRPRTGGQILIDQLKIHGVDTVFGVPGESYLAALDALYDARNRIRFIVCRQEGGACNMAEAYGKLTGRPGVCFVTRGPGATNASIGLHTALQDSTPLILLIGQVARDQMDREAFQEIDYRRMLSQVTKWVVEIDDARRIPELVSQAFHRALSGRAGPVAIALPEDMLTDIVAVADAGPYKTIQAHPGAADLAGLREFLAAAQRPLMIVGGGRPRPRPTSRNSPQPTTCPSAPPSAARTSSTTSRPAMSATSPSASIPSSPSASALPTCCWSWARASARSPPAAIRWSTSRDRARG